MDRLKRIMQRICDTGEIPEGWKEGWIYPIFKKGEKNKAENYRGITLMDTAYKLYAMILEEKLREEVDRLKLLPETQAGFRKGRSGIENIYIMKTAAEKALSRKGGKLYVFFADLKAAFDKVDRKKLWKRLKETEINKGLIRRIEDL